MVSWHEVSYLPRRQALKSYNNNHDAGYLLTKRDKHPCGGRYDDEPVSMRTPFVARPGFHTTIIVFSERA